MAGGPAPQMKRKREERALKGKIIQEEQIGGGEVGGPGWASLIYSKVSIEANL